MVTQQQEQTKAYVLAGIFTLSLRLIVGWTYFSAFWRRLVLENKLIPDSSGYIGEKFNHFLPNSIGIKPIIEYLVSTPDLLCRAPFYAWFLHQVNEHRCIQPGIRYSPRLRLARYYLS